MNYEERLIRPNHTVYKEQFDSDFNGKGAGEYFIRELATLTRYLGHPTLGEGLTRTGIKRCLEVGVGIGTGIDSTPIMHVARLHFNGQALFAPRDVWAIDPALRTDRELLAVGRLRQHKDLFLRIPISVEELREQIMKGAVPPFDLVVSTGVVAVGSSTFFLDEKQGYKNGLEIIKAMKDCLNLKNPNAVIALFDYYYDRFIPCAPSHIEELGVKIVYGKQSEDNAATKTWQRILKNEGLVPPTEETFYSEIICKAI